MDNMIATATFCAFVALCFQSYGYKSSAGRTAKPVVLVFNQRCDETDWLCLVQWAEERKKQ